MESLTERQTGVAETLAQRVAREQERFPSLEPLDMLRILDELMEKYRSELFDYAAPASRLGIMHIQSLDALKTVCESFLDGDTNKDHESLLESLQRVRQSIALRNHT